MTSTPKNAASYRLSISQLLSEAEASFEAALKTRDAALAPSMSQEQMHQYLKGIDVIVSEESMISLRAEFLRYSSIFDTQQTREAIRHAVAETTKPLLETWVNEHMHEIARKVVAEAITRIAQTRRPSAPAATATPPPVPPPV